MTDPNPARVPRAAVGLRRGSVAHDLALLAVLLLLLLVLGERWEILLALMRFLRPRIAGDSVGPHCSRVALLVALRLARRADASRGKDKTGEVTDLVNAPSAA